MNKQEKIYSIIIFILLTIAFTSMGVSERLPSVYLIKDNVMASVAGLTLLIAIGFSVAFTLEKKDKYKLILIFIIILSIVSAYGLKKTSQYEDLKIATIKSQMNRLYEKYPTSTETLEIKKYIEEKNFEAIRNMDKERFFYIDSPIETILDVKKHNDSELNELLKNALIDNYINNYEVKKIQESYLKFMIKKIKN